MCIKYWQLILNNFFVKLLNKISLTVISSKNSEQKSYGCLFI